jgi:cysteinyl-tRNA synthetase
LLQDVLAQYDSDVIRFGLLRNSYSTDIDITDTLFPEAKKHVYKMYSVMNDVQMRSFDNANTDKTSEMIEKIKTEFETSMNDNFNTSGVMAALFTWFNFIGAELAKKSTEYDLKPIVAKIKDLMSVLNILQQDVATYIDATKQEVLKKHNIAESDILDAISARANAKAAKDWTTADSIRNDLSAKGILLKDGVNGTSWDVVL